MTADSPRKAPFWALYNPDNPVHAGVLATLRQGFDREPGDLPAMWPHYLHLADAGDITPELTAEHLALCMFGVHQQGIRTKVHVSSKPGTASGSESQRKWGSSFASALNRLRAQGKFSESALDARVAQAVTSPSVAGLAYHLRGLITMLKTLPTSTFDYDRLARDLEAWQEPERMARVRLHWGIDYMHTSNSASTSQKGD